jgi:hypothetical protein
MKAVVHLVGGGAVELLHAADHLADLIVQIRTERVLVGRLRDEDGQSHAAIVPSNRIQLVLADCELP